jgi:hypothetical protein
MDSFPPTRPPALYARQHSLATIAARTSSPALNTTSVARPPAHPRAAASQSPSACDAASTPDLHHRCPHILIVLLHVLDRLRSIACNPASTDLRCRRPQLPTTARDKEIDRHRR